MNDSIINATAGLFGVAVMADVAGKVLKTIPKEMKIKPVTIQKIKTKDLNRIKPTKISW